LSGNEPAPPIFVKGSSLCKLKIRVKLLEDGIYGLFFRFCFQGRLDTIYLSLIQFNGFSHKCYLLLYLTDKNCLFLMI